MMMDSYGNIIYVGKSKDLKNRVSQYFQKQKDRPPKIADMIRNIHSFDYIVLDTELDAFLEECRLIKELKPMYNSLLKNDQKYTYIKLTNEEYPRFICVTEKSGDTAKYFGPFTNLHMAECAIKFFEEFYPIRKCPVSSLQAKSNGCLYLQLGTCVGTCTGKISPDAYKEITEEIIRILEGKDKAPLQVLHNKMKDASNYMDFEKALKYRDYYRSLKHVLSKQRLIRSSKSNRNILAIEFIDKRFVKVFFIRGNRMLFSRIFEVSHATKQEFIETLKEIFIVNSNQSLYKAMI